MIRLDISVSEVKIRPIDGVIYYFVNARFANIEFVSPSVTSQNSISNVIDATVYDIQHIGKDFTVCPRCSGHLFHARGSRGAGGCPCGQTVGYVGGGRTGVDKRYTLAGVYYV